MPAALRPSAAAPAGAEVSPAKALEAAVEQRLQLPLAPEFALNGLAPLPGALLMTSHPALTTTPLMGHSGAERFDGPQTDHRTVDFRGHGFTLNALNFLGNRPGKCISFRLHSAARTMSRRSLRRPSPTTGRC